MIPETSPVIISQSKEADADYNVPKIALLGTLGAGLNLVTIWLFNQFLANASYSSLFWGAFVGGMYIAFVTLQAVMIKGREKIRLLVLVETALPIVLFYKHLYPAPSATLIVGLMLYTVIVTNAAIQGTRALMNSLRIRFMAIAHTVVPKAITGMLVFASILLYANYFEWGAFKPQIGQKLIHELLASSEGIVRIFVPGFSVDKPIDEALASFTEHELQKNGVPSAEAPGTTITFNNLPETTQKLLVNEVSGRFHAAFERILGPFGATETFDTVVYRALKNVFEHLPESSQVIVGIAIAFIVFLLFRSIVVLLYWLVEIFAFLMYKFLLSVRFAHISIETRSREFVSLS